MKAGWARPYPLRRLACLFLAFAMVATALVFTAPDSAAQDQRQQPRRTFIQRLLFGNYYYYREPPRQVRPARPRKKVTKAQPKRSSEPVEPAIVAVEKQPDAKVILVVGDFLGSGLAEGLTDAYAQTPGIRVVDRSSGSSGFVRDDFFNWPEQIGPMVETEKPAAIVVMLGSNDRQQIRTGDTRADKLSEAWIKEYEARATVFAAGARQNDAPLIWVGMPAFKSTSMTADMLALNDIYRRVAENAKGEFVDVWDGFVDENGAFVMSGPDMNGQPVRLRSSDGINVTKAGKRKLAFYAEKPLAKIFGDAKAPAIGVPTPTLPEITVDPAAIAKIDRTVPISFTDPELDGGSELLGLKVSPKPKPTTPGERLAIEGVASDATPGRADDFGGGKTPAAVAAPVLPEPETTTATRQ
ncbi:hypothetical protein SAMN04488498_107185 [Mesorhizobium albiziae]|uniref:Uncharacterized protein n=1 Tax=Neomesorhizobium albiziae TaxID=335020 RepID=A0A1I4A8C5_9HYPH|nr:DUF459 domain-containing protein [Mesorhizobium albiziae]GLS34076.1 hypothetical protein GCM10007937_57890 [Mesorhizobium albiziae]SFK52056.1 hypothetical protein SAMN04488498_107185 [Mesorhizobium albiziae]